MDWQGALRARLLEAPAVAELVAQRVTWVDRPQAAALPAITLQIIFEDRAQHMTGFVGRQFASVQVDVWASSSTEAASLKEAVIAALVPKTTTQGIRFGRALVTARDQSERTEAQFIYRPSLDFSINYAPE